MCYAFFNSGVVWRSAILGVQVCSAALIAVARDLGALGGPLRVASANGRDVLRAPGGKKESLYTQLLGSSPPR